MDYNKLAKPGKGGVADVSTGKRRALLIVGIVLGLWLASCLIQAATSPAFACPAWSVDYGNGDCSTDEPDSDITWTDNEK